MDTSEIYIKMCDCPEIQGQRNERVPYLHDFVRDIHHTESWIKDCGWQEKSVWLPRQDQIQEMFDEQWFKDRGWSKDWEVLFDCLNNFGYEGQFATPEQAWLAFYMHEKHKKKWDGEKWVKA